MAGTENVALVGKISNGYLLSQKEGSHLEDLIIDGSVILKRARTCFLYIFIFGDRAGAYRRLS
jgi:hypothetical protein